MYISRTDLIYLSLARAGGLPLTRSAPPVLDADFAWHATRSAELREQEQERWRQERRAARGRAFAAAGRSLARGLSATARLLAEPLRRRQSPPAIKGCG